jgi:hypothetical protein
MVKWHRNYIIFNRRYMEELSETYSNNKNLFNERTYELTHSGEKPLACEECDFQYN